MRPTYARFPRVTPPDCACLATAPAPVEVLEEIEVCRSTGNDFDHDWRDLLLVMQRRPGFIGMTWHRTSEHRYRLSSLWASRAAFIEWTRCAIFVAVAARLAARRVTIQVRRGPDRSPPASGRLAERPA